MKKTTLLAAIIALFMFANCGGDSTSGKAEPMIRLSDNEFNVSSLGEDITIDILATCMWEAKSSADWITLSRAKGGVDDKYCIISVAVNKSTTQRTATVVFSNSTYALSQKVQVVQDAYSVDLVSPEDIEVDYQAGTKSIEVRSNVDFEVKMAQNSWLTVSKSENNLRFTYQANSSQESRSVAVTLTNDDYDISESFNFIQGPAPEDDGGDDPIDAELLCPEDIEVDYQAGSKSIEVRTNVDFAVKLAQNSWLTVSKSENNLRFTYQANSSQESRSAAITLTNDDYNLSESFNFTQGGAPQGDGGDQGDVVMWRDWAELPVCNEREGFDYVVHGGITVGSKSNQRNFTICFDREHKLATWVAYPLHDAHIGSSGRTEDWGYGPGIPEQYQPNLSKSYNGNYDRGHQIPSGDRTGSKEMNRHTFYYSNMTPQASQFNQGGWATLENDVRSEICSDTLYVVTGALFLSSNDSSIASSTTDKSGKTCPIPSHYYKVLLRTKSGNTGKRIQDITNASELKAIAILIKHKSTCNIQNSDYISIKELEQKSGYTFFPNLNDAVEDAVKQQCSPSSWF